jgi:hypothetical protein
MFMQYYMQLAQVFANAALCDDAVLIAAVELLREVANGEEADTGALKLAMDEVYEQDMRDAGGRRAADSLLAREALREALYLFDEECDDRALHELTLGIVQRQRAIYVIYGE